VLLAAPACSGHITGIVLPITGGVGADCFSLQGPPSSRQFMIFMKGTPFRVPDGSAPQSALASRPYEEWSDTER
jgi:hypothetical protein